jgi:hypothetical protein
MSTYTDASLIYYPSGYKASKAYSLKPTDGNGDLDFTRASTATRVNESGLIEEVAANVPRIDYTGGGCGKLLLEPQRTNLVTQSVALSSWSFSNWTKTINSATAPDGTNTANLIEQATNGLIYGSPATAEGTLSVFLKYNSAMQFFQIMGNGDNNTYANFDIVNGLVGNIGSLSKAEIKDYGSGWYRISMTILTGATLDYFRIKSVTSLTAAWNNGTIFSGSFYAWGGQVETGHPTSYIPTTSTAVTRVADSASKSGISSLIGQTEGTFFMDFNNTKTDSVSRYIYAISNGNSTDFNFESVISNSNQLLISSRNNATTQVSYNYGVLSLQRYKIAYSYSENNTRIFVNGVLVAIDTLCTIPATDSVKLGMRSNNTGHLNDSINQLLLFKTQLTDAECINLTTL